MSAVLELGAHDFSTRVFYGLGVHAYLVLVSFLNLTNVIHDGFFQLFIIGLIVV